MTLVSTIDGWAVAIAAGAAFAAAFLMALRKRTAGEFALMLSFAGAVAAVAWRWTDAARPPISSLGEIFTAMGAMAWPVGILCRRRCRMPVGFADAAWALALLFPAAFVFPARSAPMPAILESPYFAPHVMACLLGYMVAFKAAVAAVGSLRAGGIERDLAARDAVSLAWPALTLLATGLVLGSLWGAAAWGDWWNWDPKELLTLSALLALAAGLAFGSDRPKRACVAILVSALLMLVTLSWANLSAVFAGLHSYA